ncbi:hypothetical protein Moror_8056 [Moniliophthora roreri MCA 2997]|uniref:Uncharacterized protein n=1 Tax=Moniliophthora roreri (strain MCA 2997) TaxID=1381753 RepID=V2X5J3_MONRO|nr:hypothetical protein Moror_8056 [Moniliophthora roreri MCA 2997]
MAQSKAQEDEIVEDSEPEREALRQDLNKLRGSTLSSSDKGKQSLKDDNEDVEQADVISVIEISDDSVTVPPPAQKARQKTPEEISVLDISSSSSSASPALPPKPTTSTSEPIVRVTNESDGAIDDLPSDDDLPSLSLSNFAFATSNKPGGVKSTATVRNFATLAASKNASSGIPEKNAPKKPPRCIIHKFAEQFTDEQLSRLLKCVACDVRWTVRKSASQKVTHIRSCAKKNGFQDETVCRLIRKEVEKVLPASSGDKGKGEAEVEPLAETIFNEIVHDAAPKKRTKRQEVVTTLKALSETRSAILDRAKTIFAQNNHAYHTRQQEQVLPSLGGLPSTSGFGVSGLGRTKGRQQSIFSFPSSPGKESNDGDHIFPMLRATRRSPSSPVLHTSDVANVETITPKESNPKSSTPLVYISSSSSDDPPKRLKTAKKNQEKSPSTSHVTPLLEEEERQIYDEAEDLFHNRNAYLHYEPHQSVTTSSNVDQPTDPFPTKDTLITSRACTTTSATGPFIIPKPVTPKKRRRRDDKAKASGNVQFDEAWEQRLKRDILADTELHLRILRYEVISVQPFELTVINQPST